MINRFPATGFNRINLDWIMRELKNVKTVTDNIGEAVEDAQQAAAEAVAAAAAATQAAEDAVEALSGIEEDVAEALQTANAAQSTATGASNAAATALSRANTAQSTAEQAQSTIDNAVLQAAVTAVTANGSSSNTLSGLTANHVVGSWGMFSDAACTTPIPANNPTCDITITTAANAWTLTIANFATTFYIRPTFILKQN